MGKVSNAICLGCKAVAGISAGYLAYKLMDDNTEELVVNGGVVNAFTIGAGQGAIAMVIGKIVYWIF